MDDNNGCFKDAGRALATIFSFGITCAVQDGVMKELQRNKNRMQDHMNSFVGDVGPHIKNLSKLSSVAGTLYTEADKSVKLVRHLETDLANRASAFKRTADKSSLSIRLQAMRSKMLGDIDNLLNTCQAVQTHGTSRSRAFENVVNSIRAASLMNLYEMQK